MSVSPTSVVILSERSFALQCKATGYPQPSINWRKSDGDMPTDFTVVNGTMHVTKVKLQDAGVYQCEASNRGGNITRIANVTVLGICFSVFIRVAQALSHTLCRDASCHASSIFAPDRLNFGMTIDSASKHASKQASNLYLLIQVRGSGSYTADVDLQLVPPD